MDINFIKTYLNMLIFYFESVTEVDRLMVLSFLEGMMEMLKR